MHDHHPVPPLARALSFLSLAALMFVESAFHHSLNDGGSPLSSRLGLPLDAAEKWCDAPQKMLRLDGAIELIDHTLRALLPRGGLACADCFRLLLHFTMAMLVLAAAVSLPQVSCRLAGGRLGRRLPALLAALGALTLEATFEALHASNHRWLLPSLSVAALALDDPLRPSALARDACAAMAAGIFACAAFSKLTSDHDASSLAATTDNNPSLLPALPSLSLRWASAEPLRWHPSRYGGRGAMVLAALDSAWFLPAASMASLALELASVPLLLLRGRHRHPAYSALLALSWSCFHVGVLAFMPSVNYLPSALVYLGVVFPWRPSLDWLSSQLQEGLTSHPRRRRKGLLRVGARTDHESTDSIRTAASRPDGKAGCAAARAARGPCEWLCARRGDAARDVATHLGAHVQPVARRDVEHGVPQRGQRRAVDARGPALVNDELEVV